MGSGLYYQMLRASQRSAGQLLALILDHHLHSWVDHNGFLQLQPTSYRWSPAPLPSLAFYSYFRQLVRDAYPGALGLREDELGHRLHLFRPYLDAGPLDFIHCYSRNLPTSASDYDRLCQFAKDYHLRLDFQTAAAFHNRYHDRFDYPHNMKVQLVCNSYRRRENPARMIEFIIDIDTGAFVSEWNVYRRRLDGTIDADPAHYSTADRQQIANTESFNYGLSRGPYHLWPRDRQSHQCLDVQQPRDSQIRRHAKQEWHTPRQYADLVKSPRDVIAWRQVPRGERAAVYQQFLCWIQAGHRNRGIADFL